MELNLDEFMRKFKENSENTFTLPEAKAAINCFIYTLAQAICEGETVVFHGFGKFEARRRGGQIARNPQTMEECRIPFKMCPVFIPSKVFKEEGGECLILTEE